MMWAVIVSSTSVFADPLPQRVMWTANHERAVRWAMRYKRIFGRRADVSIEEYY
jgi:hypothetical protein